MSNELFRNTLATNGISHRSNYRKRKSRWAPAIVLAAAAYAVAYIALV